MSTDATLVRVAVDIPDSEGFDYHFPEAMGVPRVGLWVLIPWGRGRRVGLVMSLLDRSGVDEARLREVLAVLDGPELPPQWLALAHFVARYYHRGLSEVMLSAIPKVLRTPGAPRTRTSVFERARARWPAIAGSEGAPPILPTGAAAEREPTPEQAQALHAMEPGVAPSGVLTTLVHGVTGSGKTEVYLRWLANRLASRSDAQVLLMVPEIALTPQLHAQVRDRFPGERVAVLHSEMPDGERAAHWLAAAEGRARVVVGTRLAVFTPLPGLAGIVVDEEHDPSYKQQEGSRYSARDLAVMLGAQAGIPVVLGSATPSLESWNAAQTGRYRLVRLRQRVGEARLPSLRRIDMRGVRSEHGLAEPTVTAIAATLAAGRQVLVFINRRGWAPVLTCAGCGWLSRCDDCSGFRVLHRTGGSRFMLACHHCGARQAVPRSCPECGALDLAPVGQGSQRLHETLVDLFPQARVARVDRDVARRRGAAREAIEAAHAGEVDILVGTQMLAKGHDFRRLALVVVVDADAAFYASDFRAPERLFALLMQVAGRSGRSGEPGEVLVQTRFPDHPVLDALARHDFEGFAQTQLDERRSAGLPPYAHQALLRAEAPSLEAALAFLDRARAQALALGLPEGLAVADPVPMPLARVAGRSRAQLLLESARRPPLHALIDRWLPSLSTVASTVRWQLEVDPAEI